MSNNPLSGNSIFLRDYAQNVQDTNKLTSSKLTPSELTASELEPILFGLFGEVGSLMSVAKKLCREKSAFYEYDHAIKEEFGDVLWYFSVLCWCCDIKIEDIFSEVTNQRYTKNIATSDIIGHPVSVVLSHEIITETSFNEKFLDLGNATTALFELIKKKECAHDMLCKFLNCYLQMIQEADVNFSKVVCMNIKKTSERFTKTILPKSLEFDSAFEEEERFPREFEIEIIQRKSGKTQMRWNGVFIGDPLTDNAYDPDGYRFHDVFHFSHAAILHWSPTFRSLIKQKRKSNSKIDEVEDGGRAIVIEEGLTAWIFSRAKNLNFFEGHKTISFDILKTIQQFVKGYEVEACPLWLWEKAILHGYEVFRQIHKHKGGKVTGNLVDREIRFYRS